MKAVIYARISRDEQSKYSIGEQVELCQKKMIEDGHEVVDIFVDEGYSSKTMKRPALQSMLSQIKSKKFNIICVWNSDRLTRTVLDGLEMVIKMFRPNGIEFVSYTEDIDTSTPDGMMMFTIRLSMAQRERERIAERSSMGQIARARRGLRNSPTRPFGYDVDKTEDLKLSINEEEADIVRLIYNRFLSGWGRIKIARTLNEENKRPKGGGLWYESMVTDILVNPTYMGATHYKPEDWPEEKRIIVPNMHQAIVSETMFRDVQKNLRRRKEQHMSTSSYDFPFSTILKCGECGRSYHGKTTTYSGPRKGVRLYRCSGKYRVNPCKESSDLSELKLVKLFMDFLDSFEFEADRPNAPQGGRDIEKDRKRLEKLIDESAVKKKNYARAMGSGKLDYETFEELIDEENRKVAEWQRELDDLGNIVVPKRTRREVALLVHHLRTKWDMMNDVQRKLSVQQLFEIIVIKKTGKDWQITGYRIAEL